MRRKPGAGCDSQPPYVGGAGAAQGPVAAGLRAIGDPGPRLVRERVPLHRAEEGRAGLVAALAVTRAVPLAVVMVHPLRGERGGARVAGVAGQARAVEALGLVGNVVGGPCQPRTARDVAGAAGSRDDARMVVCRRQPGTSGSMAGVAGRRGLDVIRRLACRSDAVARGAGSRGDARMVESR